MNDIIVEIGRPLEGVSVRPISPLEHPVPVLRVLSPTVFLIVLQETWTKKEKRNFKNRISIDIAQINCILDIVFSIQGDLEFDIPYHAGAYLESEIKYSLLEDGQGFAFHIVFIDENCIVLNSRLISLTTDKSNDLIKVLIEQQQQPLEKDKYMAIINNIYKDMSVSKVKKEAFIHQNSFYSL